MGRQSLAFWGHFCPFWASVGSYNSQIWVCHVNRDWIWVHMGCVDGVYDRYLNSYVAKRGLQFSVKKGIHKNFKKQKGIFL